MFRRKGLTEFCGKLGEFCKELGEFALAHKQRKKAQRNSLSSLPGARGGPQKLAELGVGKTRVGHTPSTAGTFRKKFRKDPGNALRAFPGIPLESTAGMPQTL